MPYCDVVERHSVSIRAPADVALSVAGQLDFEESPIVRALINVREFLLGSNPPAQVLPAGLLEKTKALGWGVLSEIPGREIVMGAATQPWQANVVFRSFEPWRFAAFDDPEFVKIAWTLRADPVTETTCIFRTETRVVACGPAARAKFRRYWAFLSPGIIVIRMALLGPLKRKAERRAREFRAVPAANPA